MAKPEINRMRLTVKTECPSNPIWNYTQTDVADVRDRGRLGAVSRANNNRLIQLREELGGLPADIKVTVTEEWYYEPEPSRNN